jgi:DNA primase
VRAKESEDAIHELTDQVIEEEIGINLENVVQLQERETIRLLIRYADRKLTEQVLGLFLVNELDDIEFISPVYKKIFNKFIDAAEHGNPIDSRKLLEEGDAEVRSAVAELMVDKYSLSPHWQGKYKISVPREDDDLERLAVTNVRRLKYRLIQVMIEANREKLKHAPTAEEQDEILEKQMALKKADGILAEELSIVAGQY